MEKLRVTTIALDDGTIYTPYCGDSGQLGFRCETPGQEPVYLYFNPSDHIGDDVPNIFVYSGPTGDPAKDTPLHHYVVWEKECLANCGAELQEGEGPLFCNECTREMQECKDHGIDAVRYLAAVREASYLPG